MFPISFVDFFGRFAVNVPRQKEILDSLRNERDDDDEENLQSSVAARFCSGLRSVLRLFDQWRLPRFLFDGDGLTVVKV